MGFYDEEFTIQTTVDRCYRKFHNDRIDDDVREWANEQIRSIQSDLDQVLQFDDGYRDFLLEYMSTEVDRLSDGERTDPVCTCEDLGCPLKDGRLPRVVQQSDTIEDGIKKYKQTHRGTPRVLIDAAQTWREKRRDCWFVLRHVESHMTEDRTERPEDPAPSIDEEERSALPALGD